LGRDKIVEGPLLKNFQKYFLTTKPWEPKIFITRKSTGTRDFKEKEISYQKVVLGFHRTKESLNHLLNNFLGSLKRFFETY
jgi:hypothetical protein